MNMNKRRLIKVDFKYSFTPEELRTIEQMRCEEGSGSPEKDQQLQKTSYQAESDFNLFLAKHKELQEEAAKKKALNESRKAREDNASHLAPSKIPVTLIRSKKTNLPSVDFIAKNKELVQKIAEREKKKNAEIQTQRKTSPLYAVRKSLEKTKGTTCVGGKKVWRN